MLLGVTLPIVVFEVLGYACLSLCIWHALHQGPLRRARLIELGIGVLYGLTLETLTIVQLHVFFFPACSLLPVLSSTCPRCSVSRRRWWQ